MLAWALVVASVLVLLVPTRALAADEPVAGAPTSWDDLAGAKIAMLTGAPFEDAVREKCPDVGDILYFSTTPDMIAALHAGKVDAFVNNKAVGTLAANKNSDIALFPEPISESEMGIVFPKGSEWAPKFSAITERMRNDGTADALWDKWTGTDDAAKTIPEQDWPGSNGTLKVVACQSLEPVSYLGEKQMMGYDVDTLLLAAKELDVHLDFQAAEFSEVLAFLQAGKADIGCGSILITPERSAAMDFAPTHNNDLVLMVRVDDSAAEATAAPASSPAPAASTAPAATQGLEIPTVNDLAGKRLGAVSGSAFDELVISNLEGVSDGDFTYYNSIAELVSALKANKIDALIADQPVGKLAVSRNDGIGLIPEPIVEDHYGFVLQKDSPLTAQFNEIIARMREDGTLDEINQRWTGSDDSVKVMPEQDWDAPNGTIIVAANPEVEPSCYLADNEIVGFSVEILYNIARELGYHVDAREVSMASLIAEVQSGKADVGCSCLSITEERKKVVDMTESYYEGGVTAVVRANASEAPAQLEYNSIAELAGVRVGMGVGSVFDQIITEKNIGIDDFSYYGSFGDQVAALKSGKVDAVAADDPIARLMVSRNSGVGIIEEPLDEDNYGMALAKGSPLTSQMNAIIDGLRADGTLDALKDKWCGSDEAAKTLPEQDWDTSAGTLRVGIESSNEPMVYMRDNQVVGFEVEVLMLCARELHMGVTLSDMPFDALLASVQSGKVDVGLGCISITEERQQSMDLTVPTYNGACRFVVRTVEPDEAGSFFKGIAESFERTFITENRWMLVLSGLGITVLITVLSGLLGTALGFITVLLRRRNNRFIEMFVSAFEGLMGRLPIVVVLMVFYYVVFGSIDLPGAIVAVLVFTLAFGASAGSIMWNAVRAVDVGQSEASLALGFNDNQTFFGVVLPQAARNFLPLLSGQFVSLAKDTSVVGYIAVQDLTRAGDLIRSRTMEAFFPLLSTAAIYFGLCCLLAAGMGILIRRLDIERRPRTIKGVEL